ncbi:hypothetical protein ACFQ1L_17945 [Phytohabitans flavus]|uniref:hypothetical protein n=1 Tax=Phytohabitans flavus TaxID=1076124 RepID=UPI00362D4321
MGRGDGRGAEELSSAVMLMPYGKSLAMSITAVVAAESARRVRPVVAPLLELGVKLLDQRSQLAPYPALVPTAHLHPNTGQQPSVTTNGLLTMSGGNARAIMEVANDRRQPWSSCGRWAGRSTMWHRRRPRTRTGTRTRW